MNSKTVRAIRFELSRAHYFHIFKSYDVMNQMESSILIEIISFMIQTQLYIDSNCHRSKRSERKVAYHYFTRK